MRTISYSVNPFASILAGNRCVNGTHTHTHDARRGDVMETHEKEIYGLMIYTIQAAAAVKDAISLRRRTVRRESERELLVGMNGKKARKVIIIIKNYSNSSSNRPFAVSSNHHSRSLFHCFLLLCFRMLSWLDARI